MDKNILYNFICEVCNDNFDGKFENNTIINDNIELLSILWIKIEEEYEDIYIDEYKLFNNIKTIQDFVDMVLENE